MKTLSAILKGVTEGDDSEDSGEGICPVTGEQYACEARDESDGGACEGCEGPDEEDAEDAEDGGEDEGDEGEGDGEETDEGRRTWVAKLIEAAGKKGDKLKAKYLQGGHFKGKKGSGQRFKSCTKYMAAKGGVKDPKAVCATIARKKAMGEAADKAGYLSKWQLDLIAGDLAWYRAKGKVSDKQAEELRAIITSGDPRRVVEVKFKQRLAQIIKGDAIGEAAEVVEGIDSVMAKVQAGVRNLETTLEVDLKQLKAALEKIAKDPRRFAPQVLNALGNANAIRTNADVMVRKLTALQQELGKEEGK